MNGTRSRSKLLPGSGSDAGARLDRDQDVQQEVQQDGQLQLQLV